MPVPISVVLAWQNGTAVQYCGASFVLVLTECGTEAAVPVGAGNYSRKSTPPRGGVVAADGASAYCARSTRVPVLRERVLRAQYAVSGTEKAYGGSSGAEWVTRQLCAKDEVSAPLPPYALAMPCPRMLLRACYALSGTELAYAATGLSEAVAGCAQSGCPLPAGPYYSTPKSVLLGPEIAQTQYSSTPKSHRPRTSLPRNLTDSVQLYPEITQAQYCSTPIPRRRSTPLP
eukprot:2567101-Rhodomonas_salina.1